MTVEENIGQLLSNFYPQKKRQRVNELLQIFELKAFAKTKTKLLSGGQKQRIAIARALARNPEILLLDEPFSHTDNFTKQTFRRRFFTYLKAHQITCIVATHDKDDVLGFADTLIVLDQAKIIAKGTPESLYKNPKESLIAAFFGEFNLINNKIVYANQLRIVKSSKLKAQITSRYFKGAYYLYEAKLLNDKIVFFESPLLFNINVKVSLKIYPL